MALPTQVKQIGQRHREIMRLLALGCPKSEISDKMNIPPDTLKNIINSPLFQLEYGKIVKSKKIKQVQEVLLDAALDGANLHKQIIGGVVPITRAQLTEEAAKQGYALVPIQVSQRSATDVLNLFARTHGRVAKPEEIQGGSQYEKTLREVIVRETTITGGNGRSESKTIPPLPEMIGMTSPDEEGDTSEEGEEYLPDRDESLEDGYDDEEDDEKEDDELEGDEPSREEELKVIQPDKDPALQGDTDTNPRQGDTDTNTNEDDESILDEREQEDEWEGSGLPENVINEIKKIQLGVR